MHANINQYASIPTRYPVYIHVYAYLNSVFIYPYEWSTEISRAGQCEQKGFLTLWLKL